jgi:hypothetical protein
MLNPDRIQEKLFIRPDNPTQHKPLFAAEDAFENAKGALLSSSVIKRNKITRELSIHRVLAQEVRASMSVKDRYSSFHVAINTLCSAWPFNDALEKRHATSRWTKCEEVFPHLEHIHELYEKHRADWTDQDHTMDLVTLFQEGGAYVLSPTPMETIFAY